jgi:hypothetical protein
MLYFIEDKPSLLFTSISKALLPTSRLWVGDAVLLLRFTVIPLNMSVIVASESTAVGVNVTDKTPLTDKVYGGFCCGLNGIGESVNVLCPLLRAKFDKYGLPALVTVISYSTLVPSDAVDTTLIILPEP